MSTKPLAFGMSDSNGQSTQLGQPAGKSAGPLFSSGSERLLTVRQCVCLVRRPRGANASLLRIHALCERFRIVSGYRGFAEGQHHLIIAIQRLAVFVH